MRTVAAVVFCLLASVSTTFAQAPFPGAVQVDGGWVPCDHSIAIAAGKGCGVTTPNTPTIEPTPGTCPVYIANYYVLLTCVARPPLPVNPWTGGTFSFEVGQLYGWTYPSSHRLLVLSVTLDVDSLRRIVTGRRLSNGQPIGVPVTFFEDASGGWVPLPPPN
jgi:hypothetical protein